MAEATIVDTVQLSALRNIIQRIWHSNSDCKPSVSNYDIHLKLLTNYFHDFSLSVSYGNSALSSTGSPSVSTTSEGPLSARTGGTTEDASIKNTARSVSSNNTSNTVRNQGDSNRSSRESEITASTNEELLLTPSSSRGNENPSVDADNATTKCCSILLHYIEDNQHLLLNLAINCKANKLLLEFYLGLVYTCKNDLCNRYHLSKNDSESNLQSINKITALVYIANEVVRFEYMFIYPHMYKLSQCSKRNDGKDTEKTGSTVESCSSSSSSRADSSLELANQDHTSALGRSVNHTNDSARCSSGEVDVPINDDAKQANVFPSSNSGILSILTFNLLPHESEPLSQVISRLFAISSPLIKVYLVQIHKATARKNRNSIGESKITNAPCIGDCINHGSADDIESTAKIITHYINTTFMQNIYLFIYALFGEPRLPVQRLNMEYLSVGYSSHIKKIKLNHSIEDDVLRSLNLFDATNYAHI